MDMEPGKGIDSTKGGSSKEEVLLGSLLSCGVKAQADRTESGPRKIIQLSTNLEMLLPSIMLVFPTRQTPPLKDSFYLQHRDPQNGHAPLGVPWAFLRNQLREKGRSKADASFL